METLDIRDSACGFQGIQLTHLEHCLASYTTPHLCDMKIIVTAVTITTPDSDQLPQSEWGQILSEKIPFNFQSNTPKEAL